MKSFTGSSKLYVALGFALGVALSGSVGAAPLDKAYPRPAATRPAGSTNATVLANQILDRWQPVAQRAGSSSSAWREMYATQFSMMDISALQAIDALEVAGADDDYAHFEEAVRYAILHTYQRGGYGKTQTKLGSTSNDQVFVPIVPCRIVDTRNVGGPISAGFTRNFYFYSDNGVFSWAAQGGAPYPATTGAGTTCPGTVNPNAGAPSAAVMTVTVVSPTDAGNFILWGGANPFPIVSALNWTAGQVLANTTIVPGGGRTGTGAGGGILDFAVRYNGPTGNAHFVADIVGYVVENRATALDCVTVTNSSPFLGSVAAACAAGYTLTGGGCTSSSIFDHTYTNFPNSATTWACSFWPEAGQSLGTTLTAYARCCRIPGL